MVLSKKAACPLFLFQKYMPVPKNHYGITQDTTAKVSKTVLSGICSLYDKIYALIEREIPRPDLVIYLQGSVDLLFKRIKQRNRIYERDINYEYVEALNDAYNTFFFHYSSSPLLIINVKEFDFIGDPRDADLILGEIVNLKAPRKIISKE